MTLIIQKTFFYLTIIALSAMCTSLAAQQSDSRWTKFKLVQLGLFTEVNEYISPYHMTLGTGKMNENHYRTWNIDFKYLHQQFEGFSERTRYALELEYFSGIRDGNITYGAFLAGHLSTEDVTPEHPYAFGATLREITLLLGPKVNYVLERADKNPFVFSAKLNWIGVGIDAENSKNPNLTGPSSSNYGFDFMVNFVSYQLNVGMHF